MDHGMIVRFFGLLIISLYVYMKILDIKDVSKRKIVAAILFSLIMSVPLSYGPFLYEFIFLASIGLFVGFAARVEISLMIPAVLISVGISLGVDLLVQTIVAYGLVLPIEIVYNLVIASRENIAPEAFTSEDMRLLIVPLIENVMPYIAFVLSAVFVKLFFSMKRLKGGFVFLKNKGTRRVGVIFSLIIMMGTSFWVLLGNYVDSETGVMYLAIFFLVAINICTIGIHFWWRSHTTVLYQERLKERAIQDYQAEMEEKDRTIKKLLEDNEFLSATVHRDNKLIPAMYHAVSGFLRDSGGGPEDARERKGAGIRKELSEIMEERKATILHVQRKHKSLQSTGLDRVDYILNHMLLRASENEIQFDFVMTKNAGNIDEDMISKGKLETLLADLLENAITAVTYSAYKRILLTMGFVDGCYEIDVQDSGIPFEPETLVDLGVKKSTTHGDSGGRGIGYLTIFRILGTCKASLTISEQIPEKYAFSKSVKVRFDGESAFVVHSHRAEVRKTAHTQGEDLHIAGAQS